MAKQGRRKPATIFGEKFPNYCGGSLRERKKRQMRFDKFWPRVFICAPFVLFWTVCHFDSSSGPLTIFKKLTNLCCIGDDDDRVPIIMIMTMMVMMMMMVMIERPN